MVNDYISRQYLLDEYDRQHQGSPGGARKIIAEAPAADVVPVVRCKYCRYRVDSEKCCHPDGMLRSKDNDFCSYGKRREE